MKIASLLSVLAALALVVAGCGSSKHAADPATTAASTTTAPAAPATTQPHAVAIGPCTAPSGPLLSKIEHNVILDHAKLSHVAEVTSPAFPDTFVVSAAVSGGGADAGMVATWLARGQEGKTGLYALDGNAALISQLGGAVTADPEYVISMPGALRSRVCAGGPKVDPGVTAPVSGGGGSSAG